MVSKNLIDLTGQKIGYWTVIGRSDLLSNNHRSSLWLCRCECGVEKEVSSGSLRQGTSKSCGCYKKNRMRRDLTGEKMGRWSVVRFDGYKESKSGRSFRYWYCKCSCGVEHSVKETSLISGSSKSCGCLHREKVQSNHSNREDLTGQRFGRWVVVGEDEKKYYPGGGSSRMWVCRCECSEVRSVSSSMLKQGISRSCGCGNRSNLEADVLRYLEANGYDFETQVSYDGLISDLGKPLRFDFVVRIKTGHIAVECQGEQHYKPVSYFGGEDSFRRLLLRDQAKRDFCSSRGMELIEVRYELTTYEKVSDFMDKALNQAIA